MAVKHEPASAGGTDIVWFLRNVGKFLLWLPFGILLATAAHVESIPDRLIADALGTLLYGGALMMPMLAAYLGLLILIPEGLSDTQRRISAVLLSPLIGSLLWLTGLHVTLETVLGAVGVPVVYALIVTLPRDRDKVREHDEIARGEESG